MRILVLVKQVHDSAAATRIDETGRRVRSFETTPQRANRYDECAVEEAIRIKETREGVAVDALTAGPAWHAKSLKRAVGMGADAGIHIVTDTSDEGDPSVVSAWIAEAIDQRGYDLILAGVESEDAMQGAVGPMLAARLDVPLATAAVSLALSDDGRRVRALSEREGGVRDDLELALPSLVTIQTGINRPRYPSLSNMMRANKQGVETIDAQALAAPGARARVVRMDYPGKQRTALVLAGTPEEKAARLVAILAERGLDR